MKFYYIFLSLIALSLSFYFGYKIIYFKIYGYKVEATITDVQYSRTSYYNLTFKTNAGEIIKSRYEVQPFDIADPASIGSKIFILYDPLNPNRFTPENSTNDLIWFFIFLIAPLCCVIDYRRRYG